MHNNIFAEPNLSLVEILSDFEFEEDEMTTDKHEVTCPTCQTPRLESTWGFYVPAHDTPGTDTPCPHSDKGTRPNNSKDGKQQLCFKCGKYCSTYARFCPRCDK